MISVAPAFKKCPACGKRVPADESGCVCGRDMSGVPVFQPQSSAAPEPGPRSKVCLCGCENSADKADCGRCGRPIDHIEDSEPGSVLYLFLSADHKCCVRVTGAPLMLGRGAAQCQPYLDAKGAVSREHLKLTVMEDGALFATDISRYGTWHNGKPMPKGRARPAHDGDEFSLCSPAGTDSSVPFRLRRVSEQPPC